MANVKRGRNRVGNRSRKINLAIYCKATGFETLIGWVCLKDPTRLAQLLDLLDQSEMDELILSTQPQVVYHLAGQADVGASWDAPVTTFRINAEGTLNVLSACREAGVERVLTISSAEVYGKVPNERLPIDESLPLAPASPYAVSKAAAEMISFY